MSHSAIHYGTPHAGDQVWISPAAGIHGQGSWWALVVSTTPALIKGAVYLRVVPLDDVDGDARVREFYARTEGLLIRRCG
ncbi:hypothetical protein Athai_56890 [Actinocatenispora thailandica]|uniref:Uncharacterized protein n=1 Tax=Actinocatenispora thailandica TaxID=227318 RepID=A0A7R7DV25_9ACTN|nr:hypothetical protein [Actinocatenispora thailandica]BCJ38186.1 hypothetical protein Athai_56890 [Actinocatenispora thailandica]